MGFPEKPSSVSPRYSGGKGTPGGKGGNTQQFFELPEGGVLPEKRFGKTRKGGARRGKSFRRGN